MDGAVYEMIKTLNPNEYEIPLGDRVLMAFSIENAMDMAARDLVRSSEDYAREPSNSNHVVMAMDRVNLARYKQMHGCLTDTGSPEDAADVARYKHELDAVWPIG